MTGYSDVKICNMALRFIGVAPILSLEETSKQALACNLLYEPARDLVLCEMAWSFAVRRQALGELSDDNLTEYTYMYQLPEDPYCLQPLGLIDHPLEPWIIEGRALYTNLEDASLRYVAQVTDPEQFDAPFIKALAYRIAADTNFSLNGDSGKNKTVEMEEFYLSALRRAEGFNKASRISKPIRPKSWLDARES